MTYTFTPKSLRAVVAALKPYSGGRRTMPALSSVLMRPNGTHIDAVANDLEIAFTVPCDGVAYAADGPTLAVRLETLTTALKMAGKVGSVEIGPDGVRVAGAVLPLGMRVDEMPSSPDVTPDAIVSAVRVADLRRMLAVGYCASTDETRYNLNAVLIDRAADGAFIRGVATDGHRLHVSPTFSDCPARQKSGSGILVPRGALKALASLCDANADDAIMTWRVNENTAWVSAPSGHKVTMRLIDGQFPDYRQVIPSTQPVRVIVNRAEMLALMANVRAFLTSQDAPGVRLAFATDTNQCVAQALRGDGSAFESAPFTATRAPRTNATWIATGVNARYVHDALTALDGCESVSLGIEDDVSPIVVTGIGRADTIVVMPMRI